MKNLNLPLFIGAAAIAPLIAFSALWLSLLLLIGIAGLLHTVGIG